MIPIRFRGECAFCADPLDIRDAGVHQYVEGWVSNRTGGGANGVRLPIRHRRFACKLCVDKAAGKGDRGQLELFK